MKDNETLENQGVKNGQQIMAIVIVESPNEVAEKETQMKELEDTKTDSRLLALDDEYMQVMSSDNNTISNMFIICIHFIIVGRSVWESCKNSPQ